MSRILAGDSPDVEIWNLTVPERAGSIIQKGELNGSIPTAMAMAPNGELAVLTQSSLEIFFADRSRAGGMGVTSVAPLSGVAYLPATDGGEDTLIVCGGGVASIPYPGARALDGGYILPEANWSFFRGDYLQCVPGPQGSILAAYNDVGRNGANDGGAVIFDAATGDAKGLFARSQGGVSGVAVGAGGQVLLVGDDGSKYFNGFAALFSADGTCLEARSGGACLLTCGSCVAGDATLGASALNQAAALGDGTFLATVRNSNTGLAVSNEVIRLDGNNGLQPTLYYQGPDVFSGGPQFEALLAWPLAP